jgi:outer membrane protein
MKQSRVLFLTLLAASVPRLCFAQENRVLTLSEAIATALRLQPNLAVAVANRQASEQRLAGQQSRYFPIVTPAYRYQSQYTFGTVNRFLGDGVVTQLQQGQTTTTRQEEVTGSLRLFDSGTRDLNARQARQALRGSRYAEESARQTVIANVATSYFDALRTNALVTVSEAQVTRTQKLREAIATQIEVGVTAQKDQFQAEADYLNAQVNLLQARANADIAQAQLRSAIGLSETTPLNLADFPAPLPTTPTAIPIDQTGSAAVAKLVEQALVNRPELAQTQQAVESSATSVRLAQVAAGLAITADVAGGYQFDAAKNPLDTIGRNRLLSLAASYPLFDGGFVRSQVRTARAQVRTSQAQLESQRLTVAVEVEQAYRNLEQARASLPAAVAAQRAAQINYDAAQESFQEGVGTIVEVITAQASLVQAQTNYVQAIYTFYSADARLARAVGLVDRIGDVRS